MDISIIHINEVKYSSSEALSILSYFLADDIGPRKIDSLINWLQDDKYESAVLNYSYIKKNHDKINIYCFHDGYKREESEDRTKFETTKEELVKIANKWEELYHKYRYVKILREGDMFTLTGRDERF